VTVYGVFSVSSVISCSKKTVSIHQDQADRVPATRQACYGKGIPGKGMPEPVTPCRIHSFAPHSSANRTDTVSGQESAGKAVSGKRQALSGGKSQAHKTVTPESPPELRSPNSDLRTPISELRSPNSDLRRTVHRSLRCLRFKKEGRRLDRRGRWEMGDRRWGLVGALGNHSRTRRHNRLLWSCAPCKIRKTMTASPSIRKSSL
jgi:hypothetical protein